MVGFKGQKDKARKISNNKNKRIINSKSSIIIFINEIKIVKYRG